MDDPSASAGFPARPTLPKGVVLRTGRLVLRPARAEDVDVYTRLWTDPEVRRFLGGPLDSHRLRLRQGRFDSRPHVFSVTAGESGELIGTVSVDVAERHAGSWELAYSFLPEYWGRGYGSEAVGAVVEWVLGTAPARDASLIAVTQEANVRSRRLLAAVGMRLRERFVEFGAPHVLYGVERRDPPQRDERDQGRCERERNAHEHGDPDHGSQRSGRDTRAD